MCDLKYWMWLSLTLYPGSKDADPLLPAFDYDAKSIYDAEEEDYRKVPDLSEGAIRALSSKDLSDAEEIIEFCELNKIGMLPFDSPSFPSRLRRIERVPYLLYYRGNLFDIDDTVAVAAVGTRSCSEYGRREAYKICRDLAIGGAIIVSGMARGIDSVCHRAALDVGAKTIAVLGCGINKVYPPEHEALMDEIMESGLVISEFRPFTDPIGAHFPIRNRLISGLSLGTLVVEADLKSGAMITAKYAIKQGRDIFAVPGKVGDANSLGTNELIQKGAKMVQSGVDLLEDYEFYFPHKISIDKLPRFSKFSLNPLKKNKPILGTPKEPRARTGDESRKQEQSTEVKRPTTENKLLTDIGKVDYIPEEDYGKYKLTSEQLSVLRSMPLGCGVTSDELSRGEHSVSTVLGSMTMLEIKGLVKKIPGGKFVRMK